MNVLTRISWKGGALGLVIVYVGACVAIRAVVDSPKGAADRGLKFPHEPHAKDVDCSTCHDFAAESKTIFNHDFCVLCHEIPEDAATQPPTDPAAREACALCHTRSDYSVDARPALLMADLKFDHKAHLDKEVACNVCHADLDSKHMPPAPLKNFCMDCHAETDSQLNECAVCHKEIRREVVPTSRHGVRLAHDSPEVWQTIHGREAQLDQAYCALCHDQVEHCDSCHQTVKPDSHTISWRSRTHGLQAQWDRRNCAVCHEEDSCLQCHQNTRPESHRGRFGGPVNLHCVQCHFPAQDNNCTVCHEQIDHERALPGPHVLGIYPPDCARCHPGGLPTKAPHFTNSSVRCVVCHR